MRLPLVFEESSCVERHAISLIAHYSREQHKANGFNQILAHKLSSDGGKSRGDDVGARVLRLRYADRGFPATPRISVYGTSVAAGGSKADGGWRLMDVRVNLKDGDNTIVVSGAEHAYDPDYLEIDPVIPLV